MTVSTGARIPIAAEFIQARQTSEETAIHVTRDAFAADAPIRITGDSTYDTLQRYNLLLDTEVVPVASYNPRNTDEPLDIEHRVEDQIEEHNEDPQLE